LLQKDYHINRSAFRIQQFFKLILFKQEYKKQLSIQKLSTYFKTKYFYTQYNKSLIKIDKINAVFKKQIIYNKYYNLKNTCIKIQLWWKNYMRKKNDLKKQNIYLEDLVYQRDRKILFLEHRIIELEQRLTRSLILDKNIIHERDHNIVSLKKDIECYQKNIEERLREKIELMENIDKLKTENRILVHKLAYLKNRNDFGWLSRFFN
jgi:hypothetical protein